MNKSDIHEECKGCKKCVGTTRPYYKNEDGIIKECPCAKCLVKGICTVFCRDFYNYYYNCTSCYIRKNDC